MENKIELELTKYIDDNPSNDVILNANNEPTIFLPVVNKDSNITGLGSTGSMIDGEFFVQGLNNISKQLDKHNVEYEMLTRYDVILDLDINYKLIIK